MTKKRATLLNQSTPMSPAHSTPPIYSFLVDRGFPKKIDVAIILGSGLGSFADNIDQPIAIPYSEMPKFPQSTVQGHSGSLILGTIENKSVLAFSGRFHFYEGHEFETTVLPIKIAHAFSVKKLIISNAAGGINLDFKVGDLMIINQVLSPTKDLGFPESKGWESELRKSALKAREIADSLKIPSKMGSYLYVTGPNYETKAEIRAFRSLGGDAVGMSTAPELVEAFDLGTKAIAISLITNAAAGITSQKLNHEEVKDTAEMKEEVFAILVKGLIKEL